MYSSFVHTLRHSMVQRGQCKDLVEDALHTRDAIDTLLDLPGHLGNMACDILRLTQTADW